MNINALPEEKRIKLDRMRYTKNSLSSSLTYLAILFDVLYFVSIYESDVGSWYYKIMIGASVVYNLLFMLITFLSSEGVKNYKMGYGFTLIVMGALQIGRIFFLPMEALDATVTIKKISYPVMEQSQFVYVCVMLCLSALCAILAGVIAVVRTKKLSDYNRALASETK
ncbi:MAG: hypothetical protein IJB99_01075 [Clostridia bacterium]|nr:hypothetical protein [Clostridia bacterium]